MDREAKAESIFDLLTARNPDVRHLTPKSKSLTKVPKSLYPRQLKTWDEFNFSTLEAVYGKLLIDEARKGRPSLAYPSVLATIDDVVHDEPTTTHVLTIWNHRIVAASLQAVRDTLHPSAWVPRVSKGQDEENDIILAASTGKKNTTASTRLKPDAGAVSLCQDCGSEVERLPKDYKPASKWHSSAILDEYVRKSERWTRGQANSNEAKPIRQVYTYCVEWGCRYGCIITTREAFIFRIKPRAAEPAFTSANGCRSRKAALRKALSKDGLMEYVSIPWENHKHGNSTDYRALTVNLALWFVHILAGNAHEVGWNYRQLQDEQLTTGACTVTAMSDGSGSESDSDASKSPHRRNLLRLGSHSKKRRRDSGVSDGPHYSFAAAVESFASHSTEWLTEQSTHSSDEDVLDGDREPDTGKAGRGSNMCLPGPVRASKRLRKGKTWSARG